MRPSWWLSSVVLTSICASCASPLTPPDVDRSHGSFLANTLAERERKPARVEPTKTAPHATFLSPFGQTLPAAAGEFDELTLGGRSLRYWTFGTGHETVLLLGGIHGDERSSAEAAYDFIAELERHPAVLADRRVVIAPEVNPDGIADRTRRNDRGVDLNRNYPADNWRHADPARQHWPGSGPSSEAETRFVLMLLREFPPSRVVSTHAAAACVNWDGPARALADCMSDECGLPTRASIGYPTPGSLGSYLGLDRSIPTITLDLAHKDSVASALPAIRRALFAAVRYPEPGLSK